MADVGCWHARIAGQHVDEALEPLGPCAGIIDHGREGVGVTQAAIGSIERRQLEYIDRWQTNIGNERRATPGMTEALGERRDASILVRGEGSQCVAKGVGDQLIVVGLE